MIAVGVSASIKPVRIRIVYGEVHIQPDEGSVHHKKLGRRIVAVARGPEAQLGRIDHRGNVDDFIIQMPDPVVKGVAHVDVDAGRRHAQRPVEQRQNARTAVAGESAVVPSALRENESIRGDHANPVGFRIGDIDPAVAVHRQRHGGLQAGLHRGEPVVVGIVDTVASEGLDDVLRKIHAAHAMIVGIADQQIPLAIEEKSARTVQIRLIRRSAVAGIGHPLVMLAGDDRQISRG